MNSEIDNRRFYRRPHIEKYSEQMQKITLPSFTKIKCNSKLNSFPLFFIHQASKSNLPGAIKWTLILVRNVFTNFPTMKNIWNGWI